MTLPQALAETTPLADTPTEAEPRLHGRQLLAARALWYAIAVVVFGAFIASVFVSVARIEALCPTAACENLHASPSTATALRELGLSYVFIAGFTLALNILFMAVYSLIAVTLFWRRSDDRIALLCSVALLVFGAGTFTSQLDVLARASAAWQAPVAILNYLGSIAFILFLYAFPDGHFVPPWIRWVALAWAAQQIGHYFLVGSPFDLTTWPTVLQIAVWMGFLGSVIYAQVYRYRRVSTLKQRVQTKWIVFGIVAALIGLLVGAIIELSGAVVAPPQALLLALVGGALGTLAMLLIPLSIGVALLRYRLFDVDTLINRALVYGALTLSVILVYVFVVGFFSALFQVRGNPGISLLATGVVAVLFQPLRERLQRGVNRLVYGQRDEPYQALSRLSQRLEATLTPDAVFPALVETVAQALKLPYVAVALPEGDSMVVAAEHGAPEGEPLRAPLSYQGELVGQLLLCPRSPGEAWSREDRRLLENLAHQAGVAVHAVRLHTELQRARERLVVAREEERRRLRRDLHDGLGPQLASQALTLSAAAKLLRQDPDAAELLLSSATTHAQEAVSDIRRLVYALRPPALDDLGLVAALEEQIVQYRASGVAMRVDAPERLPALPAAVEVACYRIAQEALTNVVKHAQAKTCAVCLTVGEKLYLEVRDDGCGLPSNRHRGVGFSSMRERAMELGGSCDIISLPAGGVLVRAELPLA